MHFYIKLKSKPLRVFFFTTESSVTQNVIVFKRNSGAAPFLIYPRLFRYCTEYLFVVMKKMKYFWGFFGDRVS